MAQGDKCRSCGNEDPSNLHLHLEIENLKQRLLERESHIVNMETNLIAEVDRFPNGEFAALAEELLTWQDKYERLYEAHKRVQKVNQGLEDKLLKIVDKCETEKAALQREVGELKQRLVNADANFSCLRQENERNRNDVNLAIQLLQCKPANFVPQRFESLPAELQHKVKQYMGSKNKASSGETVRHEPKTIKVPIPTYPPTAMFYSINNKSTDKDLEEGQLNNKPVDIVSAAIVAKILEEREKERQNARHCSSCICPKQRNIAEKYTQTPPAYFDSHRQQSAILIEKSLPMKQGTSRDCGSRGQRQPEEDGSVEVLGSNILLDNAQFFVPRQSFGYGFSQQACQVHASSRSSSISSSDEGSCSKRTETQI